MNRIDKIISEIRRGISKVAEDFNSTPAKLLSFVPVADRKTYNSVIDSLYLLEDTQLAKHAFVETPLADEEFGRLYLLYYGVLNSCYMQQQAILTISNKLKIQSNIDEIKKAEAISYRNDFCAHSPNRGHGTNEHSYILDRHALKEGKVKGYTLNHKEGEVFRDVNIFTLISDWDDLLKKQLELISCKIIG